MARRTRRSPSSFAWATSTTRATRETFAEDRRALDNWGSERIERRLLELGVDRELIADGVAGRDGADELEAALELLRRRCREVPANERERERALGMLVRKGYDLELAYDAVRAFERAPAA